MARNLNWILTWGIVLGWISGWDAKKIFFAWYTEDSFSGHDIWIIIK
jgi:hypothetical protein